MNKNSALNKYHPAVPALYFCAAIVMSMFAFHPVYLLLSLCTACAYNAAFCGARTFAKQLAWQIPLAVIVAIANGILSSAGSTEIFKWGANAFYVEGFAYGACMGVMLVAVLQWFSFAGSVLASDKIMQLTGKFAPTLGLMLMMIMRLIPQFLRRGKQISNVREANTCARACTANAGESNTCAHAGAANVASANFGECACVESMLENHDSSDEQKRCLPDAEKRTSQNARVCVSTVRISPHSQTLTLLMSWGMEDSLDMSASMLARGWSSTRKRTNYTRSEIRTADFVLLMVLAVLAASSMTLIAVACSQFSFYPQMSKLVFWWGYVPYVAFLLVPAALEVREVLLWH
jgi:energy-coupling factor transport system permease protein